MPFDEGDRQPVVGRALGKCRHQHDETDEQRAGLGPGGTACRLRYGASFLAVGRQEARRTPHHRDDGKYGDRGHVYQHGNVEFHQAGAQQRGGHGSPAESCVEPRHDRLFQAEFDTGALQILGNVPDAVAEPEEEQSGADPHGRGAELHGQGGQQRARHREQQAEAHGCRRADTVRDTPGGGQADERADRQRQQQHTQLARRQRERRLDVGDAGHPGSEQNAVDGEHDEVAVAGLCNAKVLHKRDAIQEGVYRLGVVTLGKSRRTSACDYT